MKKHISKKPNIFLIVFAIIFFPITLIILLVKQVESKTIKVDNDKSYLLGETNEFEPSVIDMELLDDD